MLQLFIILAAMLSGFFCKKRLIAKKHFETFLSVSVLFILFLMGYNAGSHSSSLLLDAVQLLKIVGTFTACLFLFNFVAVNIFVKAKWSRFNLINSNVKQSVHCSQYLIESGKYLFYVLIGIIAGYILKRELVYLGLIINTVLAIILFIIGFQLRQQGVSIGKILANKIGITISLMIVISSIGAGIFSAKILDLNIKEGLVLSSGFGWYTLSGILSGHLMSQPVGTCSFLIDLLREIIAIVLIPYFGRSNPIPFIAYSGATALDFTLPVIQINFGEDFLPIAITSGIILTILVPILIIIFSAF